MSGILVATDGSASADRALDIAADLANAADGDLFVINVNNQPTSPAELHPELRELMMTEHISMPELYDSISSEIIEKAVHRAEARHAIRIHKLLRAGEPADAILDIARDHDINCIVVGKRGLGLWSGLLHGSVSQKLVATSPCPVVVVP